MVSSSATLRNTRSVISLRLAAGERDQIADAAERVGLPFSTFIRQAALQASARVVEKVSVVRASEPETERGLVVLGDDGPSEHWVDGELVSRPPA
jgi:uncharacterized protein (DUF1778 family)